MKTALVTDGKYRSSIAAVRALHRAGYRVVVTQTRADVKSAPAVSVSKSCDDFRWIDGACADADYAEKLLSVLKEYEHPVLFCVGAVTLNTVAARREEFAALANFLIAPKETLDALNDKESVHQRALELGIPVPREYDGTPESYPVVVKPHCGEKFGLKAADRYAVANNEAEFDAIMEKMQRYDPSPIVQQKITGAGAGVSLLLGRESELLGALCHRRVREYPITGGPSTCCESFYDEKMIDEAYELLKSFHFTGLAMVEFKGRLYFGSQPPRVGQFPDDGGGAESHRRALRADRAGRASHLHGEGLPDGCKNALFPQRHGRCTELSEGGPRQGGPARSRRFLHGERGLECQGRWQGHARIP